MLAMRMLSLCISVVAAAALRCLPNGQCRDYHDSLARLEAIVDTWVQLDFEQRSALMEHVSGLSDTGGVEDGGERLALLQKQVHAHMRGAAPPVATNIILRTCKPCCQCELASNPELRQWVEEEFPEYEGSEVVYDAYNPRIDFHDNSTGLSVQTVWLQGLSIRSITALLHEKGFQKLQSAAAEEAVAGEAEVEVLAVEGGEGGNKEEKTSLSLTERLRQIKEAWEAGLLEEEEYKEMKKAAMSAVAG